MGVSAPPMLLTIKIKKTMWKEVMRYLFMRIHGRIKIIEAPVVPKRLANTAPTARKTQFTSGVASPFTLMWIPPETMYKELIRTIKLTYSIPE